MSAGLYGVELDRRLAAERALMRVMEVVETYESCGPKRQCTRDVLAAIRAAVGDVDFVRDGHARRANGG
jgi:hypothetical protein